MFQLAVSPAELVLRAAIIYFVFLIALRVFGKREIGQFTFFDLALILLVANAVQPAMTGQDASVPGGIVIIATIFGLNRGMAELRDRVPFVRRILESEPTVIARDGRWIARALKKERLDESDGEAALREHGVERIEDVKLAALEPDGSISVVPMSDGKADESRRRKRYRRPR